MYGLDEKIDLSFLANRKILRIQCGDFQTQLHFDGDIIISIEGAVSMDGKLYVDTKSVNLALSGLSGNIVLRVVNTGNGDLLLQFIDNKFLTIHDSKESYESYSISWPGGTIVV